MRKIMIYEKDIFKNTAKESKSPYFSLKTKVRRKPAFPGIPVGRSPGKEIFKEWKI
ncbi:MAG: hypothetical protein IKD83_04075 [Firmicutes bacterium]|nr:hypothetical protein [Bacillota bacterium]